MKQYKYIPCDYRMTLNSTEGFSFLDLVKMVEKKRDEQIQVH